MSVINMDDFERNGKHRLKYYTAEQVLYIRTKAIFSANSWTENKIGTKSRILYSNASFFNYQRTFLIRLFSLIFDGRSRNIHTRDWLFNYVSYNVN